MDLKEIKELVALMKTAGLAKIAIKNKDGSQIDLEREGANPVAAAAPIFHPGHAHHFPAVPATPPPAHPPAPAAEAVTGETIKSPMVGTFYDSSAPGAPAFVKEGSKVAAGDVVCIIEAMKVMNPIKAHRSGTIKKVHVQKGDPVEFAHVLFTIE